MKPSLAENTPARWGVVAVVAAVAVSGCGRKSDLEAEQARRLAVNDEARRRAEVTARVRATLQEHVLFGLDDSELRPETRRSLDAKAALLRSDAAIKLTIAGHAVERGSDDYNMALGMRRGNAVKRHLLRAGVEASRLEVQSYGERRSVDPGHDERAWAKNRRVEFIIVTPGRTAQDR